MHQEHAAYLAEPAFMATERDLPPSTAPRHDDPLSRYALPKRRQGRRQDHASDRALPPEKKPFTPTHRLAKEMRARGAKAQTY
ncbi:MAG: hypothetical protein AB2556_24685, partial [Candidatus Thiodiazotropha sp.]